MTRFIPLALVAGMATLSMFVTSPSAAKQASIKKQDLAGNPWLACDRVKHECKPPETN